MSQSLVILGASTRAAAFSALRAGLRPWTADLFADADLAARCPARRVRSYPKDLEFAAREAPPAPWMYTGALENHPGLVDRISATRLLLGNRGEVLERVRDPWRVRQALLEEGLPCPALGRDGDALAPGRWLRKPRRSAGGAHIEPIVVAEASAAGRARAPDVAQDRSVYFQQLIEGIPCAGVFVAAGGRAVLLGVSRQLIGTEWAGARGLQYAGSIGPLPLSKDERHAWRRIGECLARQFSLSGLFGVDAIANPDGVFPVEVNPRYTASVEVLERGLNLAAVALHIAACRDGRLPIESELPLAQLVGKAVLYARADNAGGENFWRFTQECNKCELWPTAADLPNPGDPLQAGDPVLTLFAEDDHEAAVERRLQAQARHVFQMLEEAQC